MKRINVVPVVVALVLSALACNFVRQLPAPIPEAVRVGGDPIRGSGVVRSEEREIGAISEVELQGIGDLIIMQGETERLRIEAEDNLLPYIITEVGSGRLLIAEQDGMALNPTRPIHFYLSVRNLEAVTLSGFGNIVADGLSLGSLSVTLSGAGNMELTHVQAEDFQVNLSGFGSLTASGSVPLQLVDLSGSGTYDAAELESSHATVNLSGFGSCTVWAEDDLDVTLSGSGSLNYYGNPSLTQNVTGFGRINHMDGK